MSRRTSSKRYFTSLKTRNINLVLCAAFLCDFETKFQRETDLYKVRK